MQSMDLTIPRARWLTVDLPTYAFDQQRALCERCMHVDVRHQRGEGMTFKVMNCLLAELGIETLVDADVHRHDTSCAGERAPAGACGPNARLYEPA